MKYLLSYFLLALSIHCFAEKYYVCVNGNDMGHNGSIEMPWATLGHAISQSNSGDTIAISVGTYTEHSLVIEKAITILGANAEYTIFQAQESVPVDNTGKNVFNIQADVEISGLTIRHASPGIKISSSGSLKLKDTNVVHCFANTAGAGINAAGDLSLSRCCVAYNKTTTAGGGIFASRSVESLVQVEISNSIISHNESSDMGGGAVITYGTLELKNSTIAFNHANSKGKGLHINTEHALVKTFTNNIIAANGTPDIGANYATSFPLTSDIDFNIISMGWAGYIDFGSNTIMNSNSNSIDTFVDSIALQSLASTGTGVLAHAINENSILAYNKAGDSASETDIRYAPRNIPDIGAYEYLEQEVMTDIQILNTDSIALLNVPLRIAVVAIPSYTTENYTLSIDPASSAQSTLKGDTLIATSPGSIIIRSVHNTNTAINDSIVLIATDEISIKSIKIILPTEYNSVIIGDQIQLTCLVTPHNANDKTVTWSLNSSDLGSITQNGLFTANEIGTVTVYATSNYNSELLDSVLVNIVNNTPVDFSVDAGTVLKENVHHPSGAVMCWLTDSDLERPRSRTMETALSEMKAGALRFPYGALSNNYLWTKDPENISDELDPCVAVQWRPPGGWDWAVDSEGYFKKDMDFDEYVALCRKIEAEPVVCVNIMSHVYFDNDDITIDTLIYYAKEWVRYANITKGYNITHWQLGNEQDHHSDIYPLNEYKVDYKHMAAAMKEIDPDIKTAPGLLQNWNDQMLAYCPEYVDFITCHQYLWFGGSESTGYDAWKNYGQSLIPHISKNYDIVRASSKPNLDIFVTETGITGGKYPDPEVFNLYKGLILFEMQMEQIFTPNVRNTFYWGTHLPWNGEFGDSPIATLFSNDDANENHMQADILMAINTHIQSKIVNRHSKSGLVTYTTLAENDSMMVIFTLNKNNIPKRFELSAENSGSFKSYEKFVFAGTSEFDANASFKLESSGDISGRQIETELQPYSITILRIALNSDAPSATSEKVKRDQNITIFPNPVGEVLNIMTKKAVSKDAVITCYSMSGKVCFRQSLNDQSTINVSKLLQGIYTIQIVDGRNVNHALFIKD
jgi:alpha-L-arabinofuranosidase